MFSASALWLAACATTPADDAAKANQDRDDAVEVLQQRTGAPVTVELNENGVTRVVNLTPKFALPTRQATPAAAAASFVAAHHDAFQLSADDASTFVATRVDVEAAHGVSHVTLQRTVDGIPVFQGGIQVLLDGGNNVVRVTADELYRVGQPVNRMILSPAQAADAAAKAFGVALGALGAGAVDGQATSFTSAASPDPIKVEPRIFQVAPGDDRLVHQVLLSWIDAHKDLQYQLALVDAETGKLVYNGSLVASAFSGRVFSFGNQPAPGDTTDHRTVVSFDGDPTASPNGWVTTPGNKTVGNNAVAATDTDGNNTVGAAETQPVATNGVFDFAFSPTTDSASERPASVTNAFFYVNDWHDRTYALGFTEAAGNFQANNFGRGGAQNDPVNVDSQDGSGTNNANFATPPDGSSPRMQMFLFNILNGNTLRQDGDFDGTVVYHENTHGLSNRLVGNGATTCLNGLQSGGMGEGWSDFVAASFLNNPVIGAYVTGNTTTGIRRMSMANSTFTYNDIKNRTLAEVHDVGELWAATLWDIRKVLGQATTERLIVQGMKNTPCNPTMLQARDGIIAADASLNAGANKCALWTVFANRLMGTGAASPNHNSTTQITTSNAVPTDCGGTQPPPVGTTRDFAATGLPINIPDNNTTGVRASLNVTPTGLDLLKLTVDVNITHTFRGDLVIQVIAPNGATATLSNRAGGAADNFITTGQDITASFPAGTPASGTWQLFVRDLAAIDTGKINSFALHVTSTN
ncbi:MAG TPA: M36 family metallopeptidase [Kofleriaceae bacterium]|nr:M36 family metallopeptidase [Kofleriaceae bacterium]